MWRSVVVSSIFAAIFSAMVLRSPGPSSIIDAPDDVYDYIVVGAGTAGCVLASRLSVDPDAKVLLVEAGGVMPWRLLVPLLAPTVQQGSADWGYTSTPQRHSSQGLWEQRQSLPRGRGLGGTGHINYMMHSLGRAGDYARWPVGWRHADLQPYFRRVERLMRPNQDALAGGSLAEAAALLARTVLPGLNYEPAGMTTSRGKRWSTYRSHLQPAWARPNLHVLLDTLVTQVLLDEYNRTIGVELMTSDGASMNVTAAREVILCGGAIASPQLLMVSGIGPEKELKKHKIKVKVNLPAVGRNLFDHLNMPMYVKFHHPPNKSISLTLESFIRFSTLTDYIFEGSGFLASNGIIGMVRDGDSAVILGAIGSIDEDSLSRLSNYKSETFRGLFPTHDDPSSQGFLLLTTCLQPKSRGRVTLRSGTMHDQPLIDPNYLSNDVDVQCHLKAMRLARLIAESREFREYGARLHFPMLEECRQHRQHLDDDALAECVLRVGAVTGHHPGSTCRMGADGTRSVVDEMLRVRQVEGLRVVDASVLPGPVSGPPNSVIVAVAERAAEMVARAAEEGTN